MLTEARLADRGNHKKAEKVPCLFLKDKIYLGTFLNSAFLGSLGSALSAISAN